MKGKGYTSVCGKNHTVFDHAGFQYLAEYRLPNWDMLH